MASSLLALAPAAAQASLCGPNGEGCEKPSFAQVALTPQFDMFSTSSLAVAFSVVLGTLLFLGGRWMVNRRKKTVGGPSATATATLPAVPTKMKTWKKLALVLVITATAYVGVVLVTDHSLRALEVVQERGELTSNSALQEKNARDESVCQNGGGEWKKAKTLYYCGSLGDVECIEEHLCVYPGQKMVADLSENGRSRLVGEGAVTFTDEQCAGDEPAKSACWVAFALKIGDARVCDRAMEVPVDIAVTNVDADEYRERCREAVAQGWELSDACRHVTDAVRRDACYEYLAWDAPELCAKVDSPKANCVCERMGEWTQKYLCYESVIDSTVPAEEKFGRCSDLGTSLGKCGSILVKFNGNVQYCGDVVDDDEFAACLKVILDKQASWPDREGVEMCARLKEGSEGRCRQMFTKYELAK